MSMRLCVALFVCATTVLPAQTPVPGVRGTRVSATGTWSSRPPVFLTLTLKADGATLSGAVSTCSTVPFVPSEIFDGRVDGNIITFKCRSVDGDRTVAFRGRIDRDEIAFTWELSVRDGGSPPELYDPFAPLPGRRIQGPPRFTAKKAPDSVGEAILARIAERSRTIPASRPVTFERILRAGQEPQNWLTYSGNLLGWRYSSLTEITPSNVKDLGLAWLWQQPRSAGRFEATPLVVDGVLYTVQAPNDVVALDAMTGRLLWTYRYPPAPAARASGGGGRVNRGLAVLGNAVFMGTLDAHLLAINAKTGQLLWNTTVADVAAPECQVPNGWTFCYSTTHAPLVVKDRVIVGAGGGDGDLPGYGIRGFVAAFDVTTGKEVWRFHTIPGVGDPGHATWSGDSWKTGGAGVWVTGAYDSDLNLTYWGTGNPIPTNGASRLGDNLYSSSVVALDADSGALKWHYQFTPHDEKDLDAAHVPGWLTWSGRHAHAKPSCGLARTVSCTRWTEAPVRCS